MIALGFSGHAMTYARAKALRDALENDVARLSATLAAFPRGPMGITPDAVKSASDYRAAKRAYDEAFKRLRAFNAGFVKSFAADIRAERRMPS